MCGRVVRHWEQWAGLRIVSDMGPGMRLLHWLLRAGVAVLAGFGRSTGWAHNLRARPRAEVLVGDTRYAATAVEVSDPLQVLRATRAVMCDAGAAGFFYGWDPRRASDEQVRRVVAETCCFHLRFDELPPWAA